MMWASIFHAQTTTTLVDGEANQFKWKEIIAWTQLWSFEDMGQLGVDFSYRQIKKKSIDSDHDITIAFESTF